MRAGQRFLRQRNELLLDGQVGIITPTVAGMTRLSVTLFRSSRDLFGIE